MAKRHKYADANLAVDSRLSSQRIAELSKYVSENIKSGANQLLCARVGQPCRVPDLSRADQ